MNEGWCQADKGINIGRRRTDDDINRMKVVRSNGWRTKVVGSKGLDKVKQGGDGRRCQLLDVCMARSTADKTL